MKKFPLVTGVISLAIIVGGVFLFSNQKQTSSSPFPPATYEYFWGDGCPHCTNVQAFFDTWEKKDQINIVKLEVWSSSQNANLMTQRIKDCKLNPTGMGVPFMVTPEGKCLSGDTPIIEHFKSL